MNDKWRAKLNYFAITDLQYQLGWNGITRTLTQSILSIFGNVFKVKNTRGLIKRIMGAFTV